MRIVRWPRTLPLRFRTLFLKNRSEQELDEELQFHLEMEIKQLLAKGISPNKARTMAGKAIGGMDRQKERCREVRAGQWLVLLGADVVFGWRQLMRRKVSTLAAILSLGLAIGACTSAFRLIDALFLRAMPVSHPERIYAVFRYGKGFSDGKPRVETSYEYPVFRQMRAAVKDQAKVVAVSYADQSDLTYGSEQEMEKAEVQYVSGAMFENFGLQPTLGRLLTENDDVTPGAHPYAVLAYDYWAHRFGKDPNVIGRTLRMGDRAYEVVGIGPKSFTGTEPGVVTDLFLPTMMNASVTHPEDAWIRILVLVNRGVSVEPVQERLHVVFETLQRERAKGFSGRPKQFLDRFLSWHVRLEHAPSGISTTQDDYRLPLTILSVLVGLVLLIACANVANLSSTQVSARAAEMSLRISLGSGRGRLVRLMLAESAILGLMAAATGMFFSIWATPFVLDQAQSSDHAIRLVLEPDWAVVLFGILLTLAATLLFGLIPALGASNVRPAVALKGAEEAPKKQRWLNGLIVAQTAFCVVVLFVAGLFVTTFTRLTQRPLLSGSTENRFIAVNGEVGSELASMLAISPGWIDVMKIPLVSGRDFRANDTSAEVALVNQTFSRQYFGASDPIGKRFAIQGVSGTIQVAGVIGNTLYQDVHEVSRSVFYLPLHPVDPEGSPTPIGSETFVVLTANRDPQAMTEMLRQTIAKAHSEFRVLNVRTQQELIDGQTIRERLLAMLAAFFAGVALLLAVIGLYSVLSYSALQRAREFGIRIAVGAPLWNIVHLVITEVFAMVISGAIAGMALAIASVRYLETLLFGVKGSDPSMLVVPVAVLLGTALLAALPAAIRAARIDPAIMLRSE